MKNIKVTAELQKKIDRAIQILKSFQTEDPYYVCYSGGKDSDVIRILCDIGDINYELHNNHTTVDAPETVRYIRQIMQQYGEPTYYDDENGERTANYGGKGYVHYPKKSMWKLIVDNKYPPTRFARYCCKTLKEGGGGGRKKVTGVRWAESLKRKNNQGVITLIGKSKDTEKIATRYQAIFSINEQQGIILNMDNDSARRTVEACYRTRNTLINPIIDWTDTDVWDFLKAYGCESNPLYKREYKRVGCIGCPLASSNNMKKEFYDYPKYRANYVRAFDRMLEKRINSNLQNGDYWNNGEAVMRWWLNEDPNQMTIEDYLKMNGEE